MTTDPNDKAFADLTHWPLDAIPNCDSGAIEIRRRGLDEALIAFGWYVGDDDVARQLEALEIAIEEKREREGIDPPSEEDDDPTDAITTPKTDGGTE